MCSYLEVDQPLQDTLLLVELGELPLEPLDLTVLGVLRRLGPWALARKPGQALLLTLGAPGPQMRAVDALLTEQLAELTTLRARIGLPEDPLLVRRAEAASLASIVAERVNVNETAGV